MKNMLMILWLGLSLATAEAYASNQKTMQLARSFRCLVCQNQNVADSDAAFAQLIRDQISMMIVNGYDDETITATLVSQYGEKIALMPRFDYRTMLLWVAPFLVFLGLGIKKFRRVNQ